MNRTAAAKASFHCWTKLYCQMAFHKEPITMRQYELEEYAQTQRIAARTRWLKKQDA